MSVPTTTASAKRDARRAVADAIRQAGPTWVAGLAPTLSGACWGRLAREGIDPMIYGTARARARNGLVERDIVGMIAPPPDCRRARPILVERLRPAFAARYEELGLVFAGPEVAGSPDVISRLRKALRWLASVPSLAAAVGAVLEVLHVAVPEEADFDVSYSDPEVPFSVFVGVGADTGAAASLRLAEGLLHESMHLQLTLIEHHLPLVAPGEIRLHSPWQNMMRPTQGVLHGTYVFAVIRDFMIALRDGGLARAEERRHVDARIATCTNEIEAATASLGGIADLTTTGRDLVARIASRISS